jgi:hypothetical protein
MRVFKGKQFNRWATGEGISDADLCHAAAEAFAGQFDADLGGYLFKKRIARQNGQLSVLTPRHWLARPISKSMY